MTSDPRGRGVGPSFTETLAGRGYQAIYRRNEVNHCPGCGRAQWIIGRKLAECAFCSTAIPLEH